MFAHTIRRFMPVLLTIVILAACGSPAGETGGTSGNQASSAPAASTAASPTTESSPAASVEASAAASPEAASAASGGELTIYSGRNEELIGALIKQYEAQSGAKVNVKYGDTAELAATILEEGENSPADVFFAQDAGALGALAKEDRLATLPDELLNQVNERFRSPEGEWVGVSGRARVVVFNTKTLTETDLPETIFGFTDPKWKGRLGWAPTNGSFQAFVTALRTLQGEDKAREWLEGIKANEPKVYDNNTAVVKAVGAGEIDAGFVNHYYLFRQIKEQGEGFAARNYFLKNGDPGALVNVAGAGVLKRSKNAAAGEKFISFLLSAEAQQYFSAQTYEYPLIEGVEPSASLPPLSTIQTPQLDLSKLEDLQGTLKLLQDVGIL
ncbi:MAG TPA: iron ABC transporter substrate-binding protein [Herpetosiphonaceae bacterium]